MAKRDGVLERFGILLRTHRGGRTQWDIARRVGVTQASYSAYETGDALPTVPVFLALLRELRIPLGKAMALLPDDDDEPDGARAAA